MFKNWIPSYSVIWKIVFNSSMWVQLLRTSNEFYLAKWYRDDIDLRALKLLPDYFQWGYFASTRPENNNALSCMDIILNRHWAFHQLYIISPQRSTVPLTDPILSQLNPVRIRIPLFLKININILQHMPSAQLAPKDFVAKLCEILILPTRVTSTSHLTLPELITLTILDEN